jgi:hypothetical protein
LSEGKYFHAVVREALIMENFGTATNLGWLSTRWIKHENPKTTIVLENSIHHDPITKLENMKRKVPPRKQN